MIAAKVWRWYQGCLAVHPVKTQMVSSAVLWGLGDIGAQAVTHHTRGTTLSLGSVTDEEKDFKVNWKRAGITSMFGFTFVGPVGHYWYEHLDRYIRHRLLMQPNSIKFVGTKVAADGLLFGPFDLLVFFSYMGFASGHSAQQVKDDVKRDFLPALLLSGTVWPVVQIVNFRFVPVRYQLLYVNLFCLLDSTFLSWIEQQGDAPWKRWVKSITGIDD